MLKSLKSAQSLKSDSFDLLSSSRGEVLQRSAGRNQCKQPKYQRDINVIMVFSCTPPSHRLCRREEEKG